MIAFRYRFHGHGSLRYVYQHGKTVHGQIFALRYAKNDRRKIYRLAVVVSKKVSKSAVKRNRIRRRLYEAFRGSDINIEKPYDLVITVFSEQVVDMEFGKLKSVLKSQLKQAGVIS